MEPGEGSADGTGDDTIFAVANEIRTIVSEAWPETGRIERRDKNDDILIAGYARAFRCFAAISEIAGPPAYGIL